MREFVLKKYGIHIQKIGIFSFMTKKADARMHDLEILSNSLPVFSIFNDYLHVLLSQKIEEIQI